MFQCFSRAGPSRPRPTEASDEIDNDVTIIEVDSVGVPSALPRAGPVSSDSVTVVEGRGGEADVTDSVADTSRSGSRRRRGTSSRGKRRSNNDQSQSDNESAKKKRQRGFLPVWKIGRPWLIYDEEKSVMFCEMCRTNKYGHADPRGLFVKGSTSFQYTSVKGHATSTKHEREESAHNAAQTPATERPADQMLARMSSARLDRMTIKFRNVHALSKHMRPYSDFVWLNHLDRIKGLDVGSVAEHASDKSAATFAHYIGEVSYFRHIIIFFIKFM